MTGTAPPVPQIPAGWGPVQADVNSWVTTPFGFLSGTTVFRGQLQGSKPLTANAWTVAQLDTILEDPYGGWSATATGSQAAYSWLCPPGCSGWYEVSVAGLAALASGTILTGAAVYLDGALWQEAAFLPGDVGDTSGASGAVPVPLQAGQDYVQLVIWTDAIVNTPAAAGRYPYMEISWVGS